jgi:hypothetical protein
MTEFARVDAVEALKDFRVWLCKSADVAQAGLDEAEGEIQRTIIWLKQEQHTFWKGQVRKRAELVIRAKLELKRKQEQKTPLGGRYSCVDERRALAVAQRRLEEAERKLANTRRWARQLEEEAFSYQGNVRGLSQSIAIDVPNGVAQLDSMIAALESYISLRPPGEQTSVPTGPDENEMTREQETASGVLDFIKEPLVIEKKYKVLWKRVPDQEVRNRVTTGDSTLGSSGTYRVSEREQDMLARLDVERIEVNAGDKVVFARGVLDHARIYLARSDTTAQDDSGWYLGFADNTPVDGYDALRMGDLLAVRPDLRHALTLPAGYVVVFDGASVEMVFCRDGTCVWPTE